MNNNIKNISESFLDQAPIPLTIWMNGIRIPLFKQIQLSIPFSEEQIIGGLWNERPVIAKLYARLERARFEVKIVELLQAAKLSTFNLLHADCSLDGKFQLLVYSAHPYFSENWQTTFFSSDDINNQPRMLNLVKLIAHLHQMGYYFAEFSLKDFIWHGSEPVILSLSKIKNTQQINETVGMNYLASNLAVFMSFRSKEVYAELLALYLKVRGLVFTSAKLQYLQKQILKKHSKTLAKFTLRDLHQQGLVRHKKNWQCYQVVRSPYDLSVFLTPELLMQNINTRLMKAGDTTTLMKVVSNNDLFVIKRYNLKGFWHGLKRAFQESRAMKCWRNAFLLEFLNFPTPRAVAAIEKRRGPLRQQAYFIMEYLSGPNLMEFCLDQSRTTDELLNMANKIFQLFSNLAGMRISHGDLKATNILIVNNAPVLLDLDSMRVHTLQKSWRKAQQKDIRRFMKNWRDYPELEKIFSSVLHHFIFTAVIPDNP